MDNFLDVKKISYKIHAMKRIYKYCLFQKLDNGNIVEVQSYNSKIKAELPILRWKDKGFFIIPKFHYEKKA